MVIEVVPDGHSCAVRGPGKVEVAEFDAVAFVLLAREQYPVEGQLQVGPAFLLAVHLDQYVVGYLITGGTDMGILGLLRVLRGLIVENTYLPGFYVPVDAVDSASDEHAGKLCLDSDLRVDNLPAFPDEARLHPGCCTEPLHGCI